LIPWPATAPRLPEAEARFATAAVVAAAWSIPRPTAVDKRLGICSEKNAAEVLVGAETAPGNGGTEFV